MNLATSFRRAMATAVAIGSCWAGSSWAIPVVWTDTVGALDRLITTNDPYTYTHLITDGPQGYVPGVDTLTSASLSIWLYDDAFFGDVPLVGDGEETVGFWLDNGFWQQANVDSLFYSLDNFDFTVTSLVTDGTLNVTVKAIRGDFAFAGSQLIATGQSNGGTSGIGGASATAVPEPTSLALFGAGLLGIGLASRLRRRGVSIK